MACQAPLSMGSSRQAYQSGLWCPPPEDLPDPWIESMSLKSPALEVGFFTTSATSEAIIVGCYCCWVAQSHPTLQHRGLQHSRLPCPSLSTGVCSDSCLLSGWCHPTISSSVAPFSSCPQSFPASGSFPVSQFFTSGGQNVGTWASASVLLMNIQVWFPLGLTGLISLLSKELSRVFFSTTVWKHQF